MQPAATQRATASTCLNVNGDFPLRMFFGHHKCATGWINGVLREVCYHMGLRFQIAHRPVDFEEEGSLRAFAQQRQADFLSYTNADAHYLDDLSFYRAFHVVRDPRDVLVSAYYSHLYSHGTKNWPELEAHRAELQQLSKEEGLFREMVFSRPEFEEMAKWDYDQDQVLEMKMEELTANPEKAFLEIVRFLDMLEGEEPTGAHRLMHAALMKTNRLNQKGRRFMPAGLPMFPVPRHRMHRIPASNVRALVEKKSFSKLAGGRRRGQENVKSHYRKGTPGDWENHLNEEHRQRFKDEFGDLLIRLGYESDHAW